MNNQSEIFNSGHRLTPLTIIDDESSELVKLQFLGKEKHYPVRMGDEIDRHCDDLIESGGSDVHEFELAYRNMMVKKTEKASKEFQRICIKLPQKWWCYED